MQTEYAKPCWSAAFINNFESNERKAAGILLTVLQHCKPQKAKDFAKRRQYSAVNHTNPPRSRLRRFASPTGAIACAFVQQKLI